jgi:hypothetical protein
MASEQQQEAQMFRSIINAIGSVIRSLGRIVRGVLAFPGRVIHGILGGGGPVSDIPGPPPVSIDSDDAPGAEFAEALERSYAMMAAIIQAWAASSLSAGAYQPIQGKLSRAVEEWLPGLRPSELLAIIDATPEAVSAHLRSQELIPGVRSVRPLAAIAWVDDTPKPAPEEPAPGHLMTAYLSESARFQAVREAAGFRPAGPC